MSPYHLHATPISRSGGRSATAASAYRSGTSIRDTRTDTLHDYTKKSGVLHKEMVMPKGRVVDRAEFWNSIEHHHKRGDAVVAREVEVSLPRQLNEEQRKALALKFVRELVDEYGVGADVALHAPRTLKPEEFEDDPDVFRMFDRKTGKYHNGNWHAHIMLSACHVRDDGTLGKKAESLDPIACKKNGNETFADTQRLRWQELVNEALELAGHAERVDHRSHAERGLTTEPGVHLGPAIAGMLRRGAHSKVQIRRDQEIADRLQKAREEGEALEAEKQSIEQSIIDLTGDIKAAKTIVLEQKIEAARPRLDSKADHALKDREAARLEQQRQAAAQERERLEAPMRDLLAGQLAEIKQREQVAIHKPAPARPRPKQGRGNGYEPGM